MTSLEQVLSGLNINTTTLSHLNYGGEENLYQLTIPFNDRVSIWLGLRSVVSETGYWPVLCTDTSDILQYTRHAWAGTKENIVRESLAEDESTPTYTAQEIVDILLEDIEAQYEAIGNSYLAYEDNKYQTSTILSNAEQWAENQEIPLEEQLGLTWAHFGAWSQTQETQVVLFPTTRWWEIPAIIRYYPADPSPSPVDHIRQWRKWAEEYGAELTHMGRAYITLRAMNPPKTPSTALLLAWEHHVYCEEIVTFDVIRRAKELFQGKAWSLGWED